MEYSMREFKKHTKWPSKIRAMHNAAKVAGKPNLELHRIQSQTPRVRGELVDKSYYFCFYHPTYYGFIIKKAPCTRSCDSTSIYGAFV